MSKGMYGHFESDADLERNGIIHDYGSFRVTLARAGGANKKFQKTLEARTKPYQRAIKTESIDPDVADEILQGVYADCVVRNWEVKQEDGTWVQGIEPPPGGGEELLLFNKENLLLTFKKLPDLYADLREQASKGALYRASLREAAAGNS